VESIPGGEQHSDSVVRYVSDVRLCYWPV
jgi:hypothetical protein